MPLHFNIVTVLGMGLPETWGSTSEERTWCALTPWLSHEDPRWQDVWWQQFLSVSTSLSSVCLPSVWSSSTIKWINVPLYFSFHWHQCCGCLQKSLLEAGYFCSLTSAGSVYAGPVGRWHLLLICNKNVQDPSQNMGEAASNTCLHSCPLVQPLQHYVWIQKLFCMLHTIKTEGC